MKSCSLTGELPLILLGLSADEAGGIDGVAVKCVDMAQNTDSEGSSRQITDAEARKRGEQTGLDTLVVRTVNDDHSMLAIHSQRLSESNKCPTWGVRSQG